MLARVPVFEESLETISAKTDLPEMMRIFLLAQQPPILTIDVFASCASGPDTLEAPLLGPAGFGNLPEGRKLSVRGRVDSAWSLARKRFDEDHTPGRKDTNSDASLANEKDYSY